jgi:Zn-dependent protease with chaperone function
MFRRLHFANGQRKDNTMLAIRSVTRAVALCAALALLVACAGAGHEMPATSKAEVNKALRDIQGAPELRATSRTMVESEKLARKVFGKLQQAAQPVCQARGRGSCWYSFEYSPEEQVNAGILINRMIFFNGLAKLLETEDEFAAVIGHEIGHHVSHHFEKGMQNRLIGALVATVIVGGLTGGDSAATEMAQDVGAQVGGLVHSVEHEFEADYIGAYLMARAGYDPDVAGAVWSKLAKASGSLETSILDTHPAGPDRLAAWRKAVEEVRYSQDLMPNLPDAPPEPRLQQARVFDGSEQVAAWHEPTYDAFAQERPPPTGSAGTSSTLADSENVKEPDALWSGRGSSDGCGAIWALSLAQQGGDLAGTLSWNTVKYNLSGRVEGGGGAGAARASKLGGIAVIKAPDALDLEFSFGSNSANGRYTIEKDDGACLARITLGRE